MELPGGPTQPEVMAVSLEKLGVQPGDTVADIGCGTGTVTKAIAALAGTSGHVYAVSGDWRIDRLRYFVGTDFGH